MRDRPLTQHLRRWNVSAEGENEFLRGINIHLQFGTGTPSHRYFTRARASFETTLIQPKRRNATPQPYRFYSWTLQYWQCQWIIWQGGKWHRLSKKPLPWNIGHIRLLCRDWLRSYTDEIETSTSNHINYVQSNMDFINIKGRYFSRDNSPSGISRVRFCSGKICPMDIRS